MKTTEEWFKELPEPYGTEAIENTPELELRMKRASLKEALVLAFIWKITPQGYAYWAGLHDIVK